MPDTDFFGNPTTQVEQGATLRLGDLVTEAKSRLIPPDVYSVFKITAVAHPEPHFVIQAYNVAHPDQRICAWEKHFVKEV